MMYNNLQFTGVDFCPALVDICRQKGLTAVESDMTALPFSDASFDGFIAVASYHHLDNDESRKKALDEMHRILKKGGRGLIVVWAKEQDKSKFIFESTIKTGKYGFDEKVIWKSKGTPYARYYHIYEKDDLQNEINDFCPCFKTDTAGWEKGNWFLQLQKVT